jgi:hypothetical protein
MRDEGERSVSQPGRSYMADFICVKGGVGIEPPRRGTAPCTPYLTSVRTAYRIKYREFYRANLLNKIYGIT